MSHRAIALGAVLVGLLAGARAEAAPDPLARAYAFEQRGKPQLALAWLERASDVATGSEREALERHGKHLGGVVMAIEAAQRQLHAGRPERSRELLERTLGELGGLEDAALRSAVYSELAKLDDQTKTDFWRRTAAPLQDGMVTALEWSLYLLLAAGVLAGLEWLRRRRLRGAQPGTALVIEDLTVDADARRSSRTILEKQLAVCVHELHELVSHGPSRLDAGLPEGTAFMRPTAPELRLDQLIVDDMTIRVGPLSLSPRNLLALFRSLWQRPYEQTIGGWLTEDDGKLRLVMERVCCGKPPEASDRWESASAAKSRAEVMTEVARHLLFVLGKPTFTANRESFVCYCRAMQHLRAQELDEAGLDLQESLRHDPSNWMARLESAELSCKLRKPTAAIAQLRHIENRMKPGGDGEELRRAVLFNRAMAFSMLGKKDRNRRAIEILDELVEARPGDKMVRGSRAAAWVAYVGEDGDQLEPARSVVAAELAWIDAHKPESPEGWIDHAQAYAMLATAHARLLLEWLSQNGDHPVDTSATYSKVTETLYSAMAMTPDFPDPYVMLARLQMKGRDEHYPNWMQEVEQNLRMVLSRDSSNEQAHYLLGKFYALPAVARYEDAKQELAKAPQVAKSHWKLAEIEHVQGNLGQALQHMRRSIFLDHHADERLWIFVTWALERQDDAMLRQEAKETARRLAMRGLTPKLKSKGQAMLDQLDQLEPTSKAA